MPIQTLRFSLKFWVIFWFFGVTTTSVSFGQEDWFLNAPMASAKQKPPQLDTVLSNALRISSQDSIRLLKQYFNLIINELEMEKQILSEDNAKVRTEIDRINLELKSAKLTSKERQTLKQDLERLQQTLVSNELAYQEAQAKTQGVSNRIGIIIDEKDSLNTAYNKTLIQVEEERRQKFIEMVALLLISALLLAISAISIISGRRIRKQKQHIEEKSLQIAQQARVLQVANSEIERQNRNIMASLSYAGRIQSALLPSTKKIQRHLPESFIFLKPREKVSGDFYWFEEIEGRLILVAADCTGHGVPGAIMSMVGMEQLNSIVKVKKMHNPAEILHCLNERIRYMLKQTKNKTRDGMDIALCVIEPNRQTIRFAGAKNPLLYVKSEDEVQQLIQIKGDRKSVGGWKNTASPFTTHTLRFETESPTFYLFSDGFQDQFGGEENRKFMRKRFQQLLFEIHHYPFAKQKEVLHETLKNWQGDNRQTDDILVIGFKL